MSPRTKRGGNGAAMSYSPLTGNNDNNSSYNNINGGDQ